MSGTSSFELINVLGSSTEKTVNDIVEQQTKAINLLVKEIDESLLHISEERSKEFFTIIEWFRTIVQECGDVGRSVSSVGRAFQTDKSQTHKKAIDILKEDLKKLDQIRTRIPQLQTTLEAAFRAVGKDIFISKVIIGISIIVAIIGVVAIITVVTFGIGAVVGCPLLCGVLVGLGITDEILIGIGATMAISGVAAAALGAARAHETTKTQDQLRNLNEIYEKLVDETSQLEKSMQLAIHQVDEIVKDNNLEVMKIAEVGVKLEASGKSLAEHSLEALNKLVDIKAQLIKAPKNGWCILQ